MPVLASLTSRVDDNLRIGDYAMALYAAGLPDGPIDQAQAAELAAVGVERLGGCTAVMQLADAYRGLSQARLAGQLTDAGFDQAMAEMWPGPYDQGLWNRCLDLDWGRRLGHL